MSKILLVTSGYPSDDSFVNIFVHRRVKEYIAYGIDVTVLAVDCKPLNIFKKIKPQKYVYDGVKVTVGSTPIIKETLEKNYFDKIVVHFAYPSLLKNILKNCKTSVVVWSHGVDTISWRRRLFNLQFSNAVKFTGYCVFNIVRRIKVARLIQKYNARLTFVFVSEWLSKIAQRDLFSKGKIKNIIVLPNPVNCDSFTYHDKKKLDRLKILSIKSFYSKYYANDLTVKAILELSKKPYFSELSFTICGKGRLWESTIKPLRKFNNVKLENRFFSGDEIKKLHKAHGVILMPSRQDTHGISTCEGMSSGLVAISSNNSAIPEYVPNNCAYLTDDYIGLVDAIEDIYYNADKFLEFSKKGAEYIRGKCDANMIINKEIELIQREGDN